jgi:cytochrome c-type biogenesis protein
VSDGLWLAMLTAAWLGILTSISPCPLATNIAAISYIGRRVGTPRAVLLSGLLYTLGRMLIIVGMLLLELISFGARGSGVGEKVGKRIEGWGLWGALILGALFALSFCPVSAALFFGSLIPLAVKTGRGWLLPSVYGVGTAAPVVVFALLLAFSAGAVGAAFNRITVFERWARRITGILFIGIGVYLSLAHIFNIFG